MTCIEHYFLAALSAASTISAIRITASSSSFCPTICSPIGPFLYVSGSSNVSPSSAFLPGHTHLPELLVELVVEPVPRHLGVLRGIHTRHRNHGRRQVGEVAPRRVPVVLPPAERLRRRRAHGAQHGVDRPPRARALRGSVPAVKLLLEEALLAELDLPVFRDRHLGLEEGLGARAQRPDPRLAREGECVVQVFLASDPPPPRRTWPSAIHTSPNNSYPRLASYAFHGTTLCPAASSAAVTSLSARAYGGAARTNPSSSMAPNTRCLPPPCSARLYRSSFHGMRSTTGSRRHGRPSMTALNASLRPSTDAASGPRTERRLSCPAVSSAAPRSHPPASCTCPRTGCAGTTGAASRAR